MQATLQADAPPIRGHGSSFVTIRAESTNDRARGYARSTPLCRAGLYIIVGPDLWPLNN